jgi:methionine synthase I (cobalamin-dependent)
VKENRCRLRHAFSGLSVPIAMPFILADYRNKLVIAAGDMRLELTRRGWPQSESPEPANLRRPEIVQDVAESFLEAGARALVTNTMGANGVRLSEEIAAGSLPAGELWMINREGAAICRRAVANHPAGPVPILGAMGPPGKLLMFAEVGEQELSEAYARQTEALADGGVDAILCCGFTEIEALTAAISAARRVANLPVIGSMVFDSGPNQNETTLGVTVPQACMAIAEAGGTIIGYESGDGPDNAAAVVALMRESGDLPIFARVTAGIPQLIDGQVVYTETPEEYAKRLAPVVKAGAGLVGGGRGASVEHVAALGQEAARLSGPSAVRKSKGV